MKKVKYIVLFVFLVASSFAQDEFTTTEKDQTLYGKKGQYLLPKAGDISVGANALPYFKYLGNIFGKTSTNTLGVGEHDIFGRYFLTDNTAVRVDIHINQIANTNNYYVTDDAKRMADPASQAELIDKHINSTNSMAIDLGYQMFRGYGRLRGFYGGGVGFGLAKRSEQYFYGNNITEVNQKPSIHDNALWNGNDRLIEHAAVSNKFFRLGAFAGVEYYFAPKICIGAEARLYYAFSWAAQSNKTYETWGGEGVKKINKTEDAPSHSSGFQTGGLGNKTDLGGVFDLNSLGSIYIMFTF